MDQRDQHMTEGARNLLTGCLRASARQQVLFVREPATETYYDPVVCDRIVAEARAMGLVVHDLTTDLVSGPDDAPDFLWRAVETVDHVVFLARMGDQMRFYPLPGPGTKVMCYALDPEMLASEVCRMPYALSQALMAELQAALDRTMSWRVTCPLGTDIAGTQPARETQPADRSDFTLRLFPDGPVRPVPCDTASGTIVTRWLPASATHRYEPFGLWLDEPVTVVVKEGRIVDFGGAAAVVSLVREHYRHVSSSLGIDPWRVHSWHVGANPKIVYPARAAADLERWNGVVHSHPRYTHFHTCGDYPPGEIANSLIDVTATFDSEVFWENGRLAFAERPEIAALTRAFPGWDDAFAMNHDIGLENAA